MSTILWCGKLSSPDKLRMVALDRLTLVSGMSMGMIIHWKKSFTDFDWFDITANILFTLYVVTTFLSVFWSSWAIIKHHLRVTGDADLSNIKKWLVFRWISGITAITGFLLLVLWFVHGCMERKWEDLTAGGWLGLVAITIFLYMLPAFIHLYSGFLTEKFIRKELQEIRKEIQAVSPTEVCEDKV